MYISVAIKMVAKMMMKTNLKAGRVRRISSQSKREPFEVEVVWYGIKIVPIVTKIEISKVPLKNDNKIASVSLI
jgi:hypothetical protein